MNTTSKTTFRWGLLTLLALVLAFCLVPTLAFADPIDYIDEYGTSQTEEALELADVRLSTGWYFVSGASTAYRLRFNVGADVCLILMDGCELNLTQDVSFPVNGSLTIYGQADGTGVLNAPKFNIGNADFALYGGTVHLSGSTAAINQAGGSFTLGNGKLIAEGSNSAANIAFPATDLNLPYMYAYRTEPGGEIFIFGFDGVDPGLPTDGQYFEYLGYVYPLDVVKGSGSGYYPAGIAVPIVADPPPAGKVFDKWIVHPIEGQFGMYTPVISFANVNAASTTLTMPASYAWIEATYKDPPPTQTQVADTGKQEPFELADTGDASILGALAWVVSSIALAGGALVPSVRKFTK